MKIRDLLVLAALLGLSGACDNSQPLKPVVPVKTAGGQVEKLPVRARNPFWGQDNDIYFDARFYNKENNPASSGEAQRVNSEIFHGKLEKMACQNAEPLIDLSRKKGSNVEYIDSLLASPEALVAGRESNFYFISVLSGEKGLEGRLENETSAFKLLEPFKAEVYPPSLVFYDSDSSGFYARALEEPRLVKWRNFRVSYDGKTVEGLESPPENIRKRQEALESINQKLGESGRERLNYAGQIKTIDGRMYVLYPCPKGLENPYVLALPLEESLFGAEEYKEIAGYFKEGGKNEN